MDRTQLEWVDSKLINLDEWVNAFVDCYGIRHTITGRQLEAARQMTKSIIHAYNNKVPYVELADNLRSSTLYDAINNKPWFESAVAFAAGWIITYKRIHDGLR